MFEGKFSVAAFKTQNRDYVRIYFQHPNYLYENTVMYYDEENDVLVSDFEAYEARLGY